VGGAACGAFFEMRLWFFAPLREEVGSCAGKRISREDAKFVRGEARIQKELIREHDYTISHH
jgi:hypothetical protein